MSVSNEKEVTVPPGQVERSDAKDVVTGSNDNQRMFSGGTIW